MHEISDEQLKQTISALAGAFSKCEGDEYNKLREIFPKEINDVENYNILNIFHIEQLIESYLQEFGENRYQLAHIVLNYSFYSSNIERLVSARESFMCEADKSRWLIRSYVQYLKTGQIFDMTVDEKCYWKPHFWSTQEWIEYFEALHALYYGKFEKYFKCIQAYSKLSI